MGSNRLEISDRCYNDVCLNEFQHDSLRVAEDFTSIFSGCNWETDWPGWSVSTSTSSSRRHRKEPQTSLHLEVHFLREDRKHCVQFSLCWKRVHVKRTCSGLPSIKHNFQSSKHCPSCSISIALSISISATPSMTWKFDIWRQQKI